MCNECNIEVAKTGEALNELMNTMRQIQNDSTGLSVAQQATFLANCTMSTLQQAAAQGELAVALRQFSLTMAVCVMRLVAAQDIHGVNFS